MQGPPIDTVIMSQLDVTSILALSSTSRTMKNEAALQVKTLHIIKSHQMHAVLARRFPNTKEIYLYSFAQFPEHQEVDIEGNHPWGTGARIRFDSDTSQRAVPFLLSFSTLQRVIFGYYCFQTNTYNQGVPHEMRDSMVPWMMQGRAVEAVVEALSAAFRVGSFPRSLEIMGLYCDNVGGCDTCKNACVNFPITNVAKFVARKSKPAIVQSRNMAVCLEMDEMACLYLSSITQMFTLSIADHLLFLIGRAHQK